MKLTIDFETRSECDLKAEGAWVYSEHPSTEVMCMAIKVDDQSAEIWINPYFLGVAKERIFTNSSLQMMTASEVVKLLNQADTIEAHNAFFERSIYKNVLFDWPEIPDSKWRCSAAKAAAHALPRALENAGEALGLRTTKDKEGYFTMMKLSRPRKPTKNDKSKWHEDPEDLIKLFKYCIQDVEAEYALSEALKDLNPKEQIVWNTNQVINTRGLHVDTKAAAAAIELVEQHKVKLKAEFVGITKTVESPTQVAALREWLEAKELKLPDLTKDTVTKALKRKLPDDVRRALEIRQSLSKSSTAKFKRMLVHDGRMRDTTMYHGAATGRWAGRRIQPHNMPRKMPDTYNEILEDVKIMDLETFELIHGDPMAALSGSIRAFICAAPGWDLLCADYYSIEGRILAWLAEEDYIVENYFSGKDPYCVFAAQMTGLEYQEIVDGYRAGSKKYDEIRFNGKTGELACGYQGGQRAIKKFAPDMPLKERKRIVKAWRANRPATVKFWKDMDMYAASAVETGLTYTWGKIKWGKANNFLHCKLPSGRLLSYYDPKIIITKMFAYATRDEEGEVEISWHKGPDVVGVGVRSPDSDFEKPSVTFMGVDSETGQWTRQLTYGGKLVENIVQAVARDLLAEALVRLEALNYPVVLHVHDEAVSEVPEGTGSVKDFVNIMTQTPKWAVGCPIGAEGFRTKRYRKG